MIRWLVSVLVPLALVTASACTDEESQGQASTAAAQCPQAAPTTGATCSAASSQPCNFFAAETQTTTSCTCGANQTWSCASSQGSGPQTPTSPGKIERLTVTAHATPATVTAPADIALTAEATGGAAPYTFTWTGPPDVPIQPASPGSATASTHVGGTATFRVDATDANGEVGHGTVSVSLSSGPAPAFAIRVCGSPSPPTCTFPSKFSTNGLQALYVFVQSSNPADNRTPRAAYGVTSYRWQILRNNAVVLERVFSDVGSADGPLATGESFVFCGTLASASCTAKNSYAFPQGDFYVIRVTAIPATGTAPSTDWAVEALAP